jgi:hypothetical protein
MTQNNTIQESKKMSTQKSKVIVSANYLDRDSNQRWLIRNEDEPVETAKVFRSIVAKNVEFTGSSIEIGFGCSKVALCESAEGSEDLAPVADEAVQLWFDGWNFFNQGSRVEKCKTLTLQTDGSMYAEI